MGNPGDTVTYQNPEMIVYNAKTKAEMTIHIVGTRMITSRGGIARGYMTDAEISNISGVGAFVLLKGSTVAMEPTPSCQRHILKNH